MKSINLIVLFLLTYSVIVAQSFTAGPINPINNADNTALKKAVTNHINSKTSNSRWYDYSSAMDDLNNNVGVLNSSYLFPDTNIYAMFGQLREKPWLHSIVQVIDPTSSVYTQVGQQVITGQDPYLLDSARIFTQYTRNTNVGIVDTLVFQFFTSNTAGEIGEYYFTGMSSMYNVDTVKFKGIPRTGTNINVSGKVTYKLPLTVLDTVTINGWNAFTVAVPSALSVNAGEVVGVSVTFIPGYSYNATDTLNNFNFIEIASMEENGANTYPTYNPGDFNSSQILPSWATVPFSGWEVMFVPEIAFVQSYGLENHLIQMQLSTTTNSVLISETDTICDGPVYYWHGEFYTTAGLHYDTVLISGGIDSIYVLNLVLNPSYHYTTDSSILSGDSIYWHSNYYSTAGIYLDNHYTTLGCDSFYTLNLTVSSASQLDLIISEYIEGSFNNKAIELYNPTASSINLQNYSIVSYSNGGTTPLSVGLSGIIEPDSTYVIVLDKRDPNGTGYDTMVDPALQLLADTFVCPVYYQNKAMYFNGNDAVVLEKNGAYIDIFGKIGEEPGLGWTTDTMNGFTSVGGAMPWTTNHTLVRKPSINIGITNNPLYFNPAVEWILYPSDYFGSIGSHTYMAPVSYNITTSSIPTTGGTVIGAGSYFDYQSCDLIAIPSPNYKFSKWTENGAFLTSDSIFTFFVNTDRNIVANFDFIDGINNVNIINEVDIFPNPSTGEFNIRLNNIKLNRIEMINNIGQIIISKQYNNPTNKISVDLQDYNSGIYIINIVDNEGRLISKKIIKK